MNSQTTRTYKSPLRKDQAEATRERILAAVGRLLTANSEQAFSLDEIAKEAQINRRTIFRYFANKDDLIDAFWSATNANAGVSWPACESDLVSRAIELFESLDAIEGIVRASHLSSAGQTLRMRANAERRAAFKLSLANVTSPLTPASAVKIEGVVQLLYSATAWLTMKDYWDLSSRDAGSAVSWAIKTLIEAAKHGNGPSDGEPTEIGASKS
jgi:AcrR family transcriptional regulator